MKKDANKKTYFMEFHKEIKKLIMKNITKENLKKTISEMTKVVFNMKTLVLILIFSCGYTLVKTHMKLHEVHKELTIKSEKYSLKEKDQLVGIMQCFKKEWHFDSCAIYLIQDKSAKKTYKELIYSDMSNMPTSIELFKDMHLEMELKAYDYVRADYYKQYNIDKKYLDNEDKAVYVFPLYHYRTLVGEMYLYYDKDDFFYNGDILTNKIIEAQVISNLIE